MKKTLFISLGLLALITLSGCSDLPSQSQSAPVYQQPVFQQQTVQQEAPVTTRSTYPSTTNQNTTPTTNTYTPPSTPTYEESSQTSCCKICSKGKACGDSCISRSYTCHKGPWCACDW